MKKQTQPLRATLLVTAEDRPGLVAGFSGFIAERGGNIVNVGEHADERNNAFLMRLEWNLKGFGMNRKKVSELPAVLDAQFHTASKIFFSDIKKRVAIMASREDHCLWDLLLRHKAGELAMDIPLVMSNHRTLKKVADYFNIPFRYIPVRGRDDKAAENAQLAYLDRNKIDVVVLAKYMQILGPSLIRSGRPIINIHHSFLPAFVGARPYEQAFNRGVKMIGATAHYATDELDQGPIIVQKTVDVDHTQSLQDFIRKGGDLEKLVLAEALRLHLNNRVIRYNNRTVVF